MRFSSPPVRAELVEARPIILSLVEGAELVEAPPIVLSSVEGAGPVEASL